MKINWSDKTNWVGAGFLVLAVIAVAHQVGEFFGLDKNSWSGWVQAIGSIAAILMSVQLVNKQHQGEVHLAAKVKRDDDLRLINILGGVLEVVLDFTQSLQERLRLSNYQNVEQVTRAVDVPHITDIRDMFLSIEVFKLPDANLAAEFMMMRRALINFIEATISSQSLYQWADEEPHRDWNPMDDEDLANRETYWRNSLYKLVDMATDCNQTCRDIFNQEAHTAS